MVRPLSVSENVFPNASTGVEYGHCPLTYTEVLADAFRTASTVSRPQTLAHELLGLSLQHNAQLVVGEGDTFLRSDPPQTMLTSGGEQITLNQSHLFVDLENGPRSCGSEHTEDLGTTRIHLRATKGGVCLGA